MKRLFMNCKDYSGHKNIKFIMETNDFRIETDNWEQLGEVDVVKNGFTHDGKTYKVHCDWSVSIAGVQ